MGGVTTVLVAAAGSSVISVVQIAADGGMTRDRPCDRHAGHPVSGGAGAGHRSTLGDRVFVFAGGGDDGLDMFTLMPDGRLLTAGRAVAGAGHGAAQHHRAERHGWWAARSSCSWRARAPASPGCGLIRASWRRRSQPAAWQRPADRRRRQRHDQRRRGQRFAEGRCRRRYPAGRCRVGFALGRRGGRCFRAGRRSA